MLCRSRGGCLQPIAADLLTQGVCPSAKGFGSKNAASICVRGGRNDSAGIHFCFSGNCEAIEVSCSESKAAFAVCVIVRSFKLNYFASTSFLHFSEGGRGVCAKNV